MARGKLCSSPTLVKDRGYAWVILIMSTLTYFVHRGFSSGVIGNLTIAHQKHFGIGLQESSLIGSVHTGLTFLLGPIASVLVKKLGCRITQLFGGGCLIVGVGLSAISTASWNAFLLFAIAALGVTCSHVASSTILSLYFEKQKLLAFSILPLGNYLGTIVWPITSQVLLDKYGYSKAMIIMAAFQVLHIVAGICFFSPKMSNTNGNWNTPENNGNSIDGSLKISDSDNKELSATSEKDLANRSGNQEYDNMALEEEGTSVSEAISQKDKGKANVIKPYSIKESFTVLLKDPKVLGFLFNSMLWNAAITVFYVLINDYIVNKTGISATETAWGITVIGITKVVGCLAVVLTSSLKYDRPLLHIASVAVYSLATIAIPFAHNKVTYYTIGAVWGFGQGATIANILAVVNHFAAPELLAILFGLMLLCEGFGSLTLTPLCTYVGVKTENKYALILAGCIGVLSSLILLPVVYADRKQKRNSQQNTVETE